jgi:hypothetical protein
MQTMFYILASIAAALIIIAVPLLAARAMILMARMEDTRRELATLIAEMGLSLQHVNRLLARTQEGLDRLRHTMDRMERILTLLQPAATVGGMLAGAKRVISGRRPAGEASGQSDREGESS